MKKKYNNIVGQGGRLGGEPFFSFQKQNVHTSHIDSERNYFWKETKLVGH